MMFFKKLFRTLLQAWSFVRDTRLSFNLYLETLFRKRFERYPSFRSAYVVLQPLLFRIFLLFFFFPGFLGFLYLFFCWYRYIDWDNHSSEPFFVLYSVRITNFVDFFHVYYRHAETTGFYVYSAFSEIKLRLFYDLLVNPRYYDWFSWTPKTVTVQEMEDTYKRFRDHVKETPYPSFPRFPVVDNFLYFLTGDSKYYLKSSYYARYLADEWMILLEQIFWFITNIPYYIFIERSDELYYNEWKLRTIHYVLLPSWNYFLVLYVDPTKAYISGWLAFIPDFTFSTPGIVLLLTAGLAVFKVILETVFSMRGLVLSLSVLIDNPSLYSTAASKSFVSALAAVYGVPFLFFSYIVLQLSIFFMPLRIYVCEFILTYVDKLYCGLWPFFTTIERAFSTNEVTREFARAQILDELADTWMWFIPITYFIFIFFIIFVFTIFLWWLLYRPLMLLYLVFYEHDHTPRPFSEVKILLSDQYSLLIKVLQLKLFLLTDYIDETSYHLRQSFLALIGRNEDYITAMQQAAVPIVNQFLAEMRELELWDKADKYAVEEMTDEQLLEHIEMEAQKKAKREAALSEMSNMSFFGPPPSLEEPYAYVVKFHRTIMRPFGYFWVFCGCMGYLIREIQFRLFLDGVAPNSVNGLQGNDDAQHVENGMNSPRDPLLWHDRRVIRYLPVRGGDMMYEVAPPTPNSNTFADLIIVTCKWFGMFALIVVITYGIMWLASKTFREVVSFYSTGAYFLLLYVLIHVFGDAFDYNLVNYTFPLNGWIDHIVTFLDNFSTSSNLTDYSDELTMQKMDSIMDRKKHLASLYNQKTGVGWIHPRGHRKYLGLNYQLDSLQEVMLRHATEFKELVTDKLEYFFDRFYHNPSSANLFKHTWTLTREDYADMYHHVAMYHNYWTLRSRQYYRFSFILTVLDIVELRTGRTYPELRALLLQFKSGKFGER